MMMMTNVVDAEDLQLLREKFKLLEHERNSYYTRSMQQMRSNKERIAELRDWTKNAKSKLKRERQVDEKSKFKLPDIDQREAQVLNIRKTLDMVTMDVKQKNLQLESLQREANLVSLEESDTRKITSPSSPNSAFFKVRELENSIDRTQLKLQETLDVKSNLETMVSRQEQEREMLKKKIFSMERALRMRVKELDNIEIMQRQANITCDDLSKELQRVRDARDIARKEHHEELKRLNDDLDYFESIPTPEEEESKDIECETKYESKYESKYEDDDEPVNVAEIFEQIKLESGAKTIDEVVAKFVMQHETLTYIQRVHDSKMRSIIELQVERDELIAAANKRNGVEEKEEKEKHISTSSMERTLNATVAGLEEILARTRALFDAKQQSLPDVDYDSILEAFSMLELQLVSAM